MTKKTKGNPRLVPMVFKLRLIADLWLVLCENIPREHLAADASRLLKAVIDSEEELCESDFSRQAWATLCARLLSVCDSEDSRDFWCLSSRRMSWSWDDAVRKMVWREVVDQWRQDGEASWDGDIVLLAAPFTYVSSCSSKTKAYLLSATSWQWTWRARTSRPGKSSSSTPCAARSTTGARALTSLRGSPRRSSRTSTRRRCTTRARRICCSRVSTCPRRRGCPPRCWTSSMNACARRTRRIRRTRRGARGC